MPPPAAAAVQTDPAAQPEWLTDVDGLLDRLRQARLLLATGDELRARALLNRLTQLRIVSDGPDSIVKWLAPILCRNADQRRVLVGVAKEYDEQQRSRWAPRSAEPPINRQEEQIVEAKKRDTRRIWLSLMVSAAVAIALSIWLWILPQPSPPAPTPDCKTATSNCPSPGPAPTPNPGLDDPIWVGLSLAVIPITIILTFLMVRQRRRAYLLRGLAPRGAVKTDIPLLARASRLFPIDRMRVPAADWRRHRWEASGRFDARASIRRTIRAGGLPTIVPGRRAVLPKYLLLVDCLGANDLLASVADQLTNRLKAEQINVERFDYRGDPSWLMRFDGGAIRQQYELSELRRSHDDHQLLVIADAASAFDSATGEARSWLATLGEWSQPILMTPRPEAQQGIAERRWQEHGFDITETSSSGVARAGRLMRRESQPPPVAAQHSPLDDLIGAYAYRWSATKPPAERQIVDLLDLLQATLDASAFELLAAIAVFPAVEPKLTLYAAEELSAAQRWQLDLETIVAQVSRLPWLRQGYLPDWLRLALVSWLEQPARRPLAVAVRAMWFRLLESRLTGNAAQGDSIRLSFAHAHVSTMRERIRAAMKHGAPDCEESILLAFLSETPVAQVVLEAPVDWRDLSPRNWRTADTIAVGFGLLAAAALIAGGKPIQGFLGTSHLDFFLTYVVPPTYAAIGVSALIILHSYLAQIRSPLSRLLTGIGGSIICTLAICPVSLLLAIIMSTPEASIDRVAVWLTLFTPLIAYGLLWINPIGTFRLREYALARTLFVDHPLVGAATATVLSLTVAFVALNVLGPAIGVDNSSSSRLTALPKFFATALDDWIYLILLIGLIGAFATVAVKCIDVSVEKAVLVGLSMAHVAGATAAVATVAILAKEAKISIDAFRAGGSAAAIGLASVICLPLAITKWRGIDPRLFRFAYAFGGLALVLEIARAVAAEFVDASPTLRGSFFWALPVLPFAYLMARLATRQTIPWQKTGIALTLQALFLAVAVVLLNGLIASSLLADRYVHYILAPVVSLGLEFGTFSLILRYWHEPIVSTERPALGPILRSLLRVGWPAMLACALVVFLAVWRFGVVPQAPHLPSAPPPPPQMSRPSTQGSNAPSSGGTAPLNAPAQGPGPLQGGGPLNGPGPLQEAGPLKGTGPLTGGGSKAPLQSGDTPPPGPIKGVEPPSPGSRSVPSAK